ncbi:MAG: PASTA domain-containing protein [Balneolaceae bacterium]
METLKAIFTNKKFYYSIGGVVLTGIVFILVLDLLIMPRYTNYNEGVTVPDVTKLSLEEAESKLERYGLRHEILDRRANTAFPANYIIDQAPSALQIVKPNRKIYLTVNTEAKPKAVVPEVVNMSLRNAEIQIENYGLTVGTKSYETSRFRNTILRQSIAPGDTVDRGTAINLAVSDGLGTRQVSVPDIVGMRLSEAQQQINRAGFRVGEIRYQASRDAEPNTILSYTPDEDELTEGETLQLIVSERFDAREESETGVIIDDTSGVDQPDTTQNQNNPPPDEL